MVANSRAKLERKKLDMIVANNLKVAGAGFGTKTNVVTLITREGEWELPLMGERIRWRPICWTRFSGAGECPVPKDPGSVYTSWVLIFSEQSPASLCPFPSTFA